MRIAIIPLFKPLNCVVHESFCHIINYICIPLMDYEIELNFISSWPLWLPIPYIDALHPLPFISYSILHVFQLLVLHILYYLEYWSLSATYIAKCFPPTLWPHFPFNEEKFMSDLRIKQLQSQLLWSGNLTLSVLVSFLVAIIALIKYPEKKNLRKKRFTLGYSSKSRVHHDGEVKMASAWSN